MEDDGLFYDYRHIRIVMARDEAPFLYFVPPIRVLEQTLMENDPHVADRGNVGHFVPPNKTRAVILEKKMTFEQLKAEPG